MKYVFVLFLFLVSCGYKVKETAQPEVDSDTNIVYIEPGYLYPNDIYIKKGEMVVWINYDANEDHSINLGFALSPPIPERKLWYYKFDNAGVYYYERNDHVPGKITVVE